MKRNSEAMRTPRSTRTTPAARGLLLALVLLAAGAGAARATTTTSSATTAKVNTDAALQKSGSALPVCASLSNA